MLVLSRKTDECIHIGDDIVVKISQIKGSRVQLAIDAPSQVKIRRGELPAKPNDTPFPQPNTQLIGAQFAG